jgi:hypothetical protein
MGSVYCTSTVLKALPRNCPSKPSSFPLVPAAQAHTRAAAVLVDELDAGGLERAANSEIIWSCH